MVENILLKAEGIAAGYDENQVIKQISLTIRKGQFIAILGRNGCGKTTLIKSLAGLQPLLEGELYIQDVNGRNISKKNFATKVSYLPQRRDLFYNMYVEDMVLLGVNPSLGRLETPGKRHRDKVIGILTEMGLDHFIGRMFLDLSEGERQLVLLARTMIQDTDIILLDEPDGALDFVNKYAILEQIRKWVVTLQKGGMTILHDPNLALSCCDRILLMEEGKIVDVVLVHEDSIEQIEEKLSLIYGDIQVIKHNQQLIMIRKMEGDD